MTIFDMKPRDLDQFDMQPRGEMRFESYFGMALRCCPELCEDCTPEDPKAVIVINDLCVPCRLVAERAFYEDR